MSETYTHTKSDPILTVDGVTRHFGGMTAVDVDHLEVQRGTSPPSSVRTAPARRRSSTC